MDFDWDPEKAKDNLAKHGVSFDEAKTIFYDLLSATIEDRDHSIHEQRFITIGWSTAGRLLTVSHLDQDGRIRIINARLASAVERKRHEEPGHD